MIRESIDLSVVVVAHDMAPGVAPNPLLLVGTPPGRHRRLTLRGDRRGQRSPQIRSDPIGSRASVATSASSGSNPHLRHPPSRRTGALELAAGTALGLVVDGARMASPGLLAACRGSACASPTRPVVATLGWHLGTVRHMDAAGVGYDQAVEDELLEEADWTRDGYALFDVSTLAASSAHGWFARWRRAAPSSCRATSVAELGGLDPAFALPGGGLVNHDLYRTSAGGTGHRARRAPRRRNVPSDPRRGGHLAPLRLGRDA